MESVAMRELDRVARAVAGKDVVVTLIGESGTGKEVLARRVHELSHRRAGPFVPINCAAIPEALFESELFGHEKGAFTGAVSQKVGRMELADKGTLFLDEIGDIPLELQPKLLRVLQDHDLMGHQLAHSTGAADFRVSNAAGASTRPCVLAAAGYLLVGWRDERDGND